MPTVSVVIPIYNAEPYLRQCLDSICGQTHQGLEIILVNDGSTDGSLSICEEYKARDQRIRLISQANHGQALARNAALGIATGEYVTFVDADDWVSADYVEQSLSHIGTADVCIFSYTRTDREGQALYTRRLPQHRRAAFVLSCSWAKLFRRSFIDRIGLRFSNKLVVEDIEFSFSWWTTDFEAATVEYYGYHYRDTGNSVTAALGHKDFDTNGVFREVELITRDRKASKRDGKYLSYYLLKLNLFLLQKKKSELSSAEFYEEWKRNDQTTTTILQQTGWKRNTWVWGEQTAVNLLVTAMECAKRLGLARLAIALIKKVY